MYFWPGANERQRPLYPRLFPISAVVSLYVRLEEDRQVEIAQVGRDGVIGAAAIRPYLSRDNAVVRLGGVCLRGDAATVRTVFDQSEDMLRHLQHHEQALVSQIKQYAACNAEHEVEFRFARWLSRAVDLTGNVDISLIHEDAALILGTQRATVSVTASEFRNRGILKYRRGDIHVNETSRLQKASCECYSKIKAGYRKSLEAHD